MQQLQVLASQQHDRPTCSTHCLLYFCMPCRFMREVPFNADCMLENVVDPSHVRSHQQLLGTACSSIWDVSAAGKWLASRLEHRLNWALLATCLSSCLLHL